jgi:HEAT repeat protein
MKIDDYLQEKGNKGAEDVSDLVMEDPKQLPALVDLMSSRSKRVKNAAAKATRIISERMPELLLPYFDKFVELTRGEDTILKWISIDLIGNLARVDSKGRINEILLKDLYTFLADESMVTASHAIDSLAEIAVNKAEFRDEITRQLLKVETIERNAECRDILLGRTMMSYSAYFDKLSLEEREAVISLAQRQLNNKRNATRKKAESFLKKYV